MFFDVHFLKESHGVVLGGVEEECSARESVIPNPHYAVLSLFLYSDVDECFILPVIRVWKTGG